MTVLTKATVLVLNRNWQAINVRDDKHFGPVESKALITDSSLIVEWSLD